MATFNVAGTSVEVKVVQPTHSNRSPGSGQATIPPNIRTSVPPAIAHHEIPLNQVPHIVPSIVPCSSKNKVSIQSSLRQPLTQLPLRAVNQEETIVEVSSKS